MFLVTIFFPRQDVDYNTVMGLSYSAKYFAYLNYVLFGYLHFFSMYVFGMYLSANKNIIDKLYNFRWLFIILMIAASYINLFTPYTNGTVPKIFLTIIVLAYLKHYDEWLISHEKLNKALDFTAKYSFGIFFIHWYVFFIYNVVFQQANVLPVTGSYLETFALVLVRFIVVTGVSLFILWASKEVLLAHNPETNTRQFFGV